ncbi:hypothetical protein LUZ60_004792 [Juncus effusus]|nr:hypothetical protein LUZ60_004792 [Juncus effusus]
MPRYYCDYCDTYLTHDSPSVRKQHNAGYKHKANVRTYYQQFEEQQTQSLIDQRIKEHLGQAAAFQQQVGAVFNQHLMQVPGGVPRPRLPILPMMPGMRPGLLPPPGAPGMRPPTSAPGYPGSMPMMTSAGPGSMPMMTSAGPTSMPMQLPSFPRPMYQMAPPPGAPTGQPGPQMSAPPQNSSQSQGGFS